MCAKKKTRKTLSEVCNRIAKWKQEKKPKRNSKKATTNCWTGKIVAYQPYVAYRRFNSRTVSIMSTNYYSSHILGSLSLCTYTSKNWLAVVTKHISHKRYHQNLSGVLFFCFIACRFYPFCFAIVFLLYYFNIFFFSLLFSAFFDFTSHLHTHHTHKAVTKISQSEHR